MIEEEGFETVEVRPLRTVWDEPTPPSQEWLAAGWFPMETCPAGPVLRPHVLYGPMVGEARSIHRVLVAGGNMWFPPEAFEPYWMPLPAQPRRVQR